MPKAIWNGVVIADSEDTVIVEGNYYFPRSALDERYIAPSDRTTRCFWKGEASYYDLHINGQVNREAVWYYPDPLPMAEMVKGRVAFWHGVQVVD